TNAVTRAVSTPCWRKWTDGPGPPGGRTTTAPRASPVATGRGARRRMRLWSRRRRWTLCPTIAYGIVIAFPRYFTVSRRTEGRRADEGNFQLRATDRLRRRQAVRTRQRPPAAAADADVRPHHPHRRPGRRARAGPDRGRTRHPARPVVLRMPFRRGSGNARLPGPGRHVAADRLLPHLAEAAGPWPRAGRGRGEVHRRSGPDREAGAVRGGHQAPDQAQADHGDRRRAHALRRPGDLHRPRPARGPVPAGRRGMSLSMGSRRVVVTGAGIVSCIGNDLATVSAALHEGRSGIAFDQAFADRGLRSQVSGVPRIDLEAQIDRKLRRFMGDAAAYAYVALRDAIAQSGLGEDQVSNPRTGLIMGSGGGSPTNQIESADTLRERGIRRVGPYQVTRTMSSTVSACLATAFGIKGLNYSISSACATSAHCIGVAAQQIQAGLQDVVFAGGGEEVSWGMAMLFDGMGALSTKYNDTPERASRAYDADRDGFVIAGGGGALVLESLEHAQARGATILGELVGF